ncbi:DUF1963 domain-containing protein [Streptomyces sp. NPDC007369]|uniref:DUF1963 domain-containing protein n=1 Tax=Streptomyces sp. NPDC007369 TaxID=3154589 RepID=UPI0033EB5FCB
MGFPAAARRTARGGGRDGGRDGGRERGCCRGRGRGAPEDSAQLPAAARLGGLPRLPDATAWPTGPAGAPLAFVAAVDCAALPGRALDVPLPSDGVLAFFASAPLDEGPAGRYRAGAAGPTPGRVLHVPADAPASVRTAPAGVSLFPAVRSDPPVRN